MNVKILPLLWMLLTFIPVWSAAGLLPPGDVPPGWSPKGELQEFPGSALYRHINGGAELFHQHGFEHLQVQDYHNGQVEIRVEVYRMRDAAGARAVFDELNSGLETSDRFGGASVLDEYQIMFVKGAYLVSVTRFEKSADSHSALQTLADKLDKAITS